MRTMADTILSAISDMVIKINRKADFYGLALLCITWPVALFLMTMDKTCYYNETCYTVYGLVERSEFIPEMAAILGFITVCGIITQVCLLYVWTGRNPLDGNGPVDVQRHLSRVLECEPSLSIEDEYLYFSVSEKAQKNVRISRIRDLIAALSA